MLLTRSQVILGRSSANSSDGYLPASRSSTPSNAERLNEANGAAERTIAYRSSTVICAGGGAWPFFLAVRLSIGGCT